MLSDKVLEINPKMQKLALGIWTRLFPRAGHLLEFPNKLAHFLYIGRSWCHFSHVSMGGHTTLVKPKGIVKAQMRTLPIQSQAFHLYVKEIFIELCCMLDTAFQILGNLFQYIFQVHFPREDQWVEFVQLSMSLHPGSYPGLSHEPQCSLLKPTSALLHHVSEPVS